MNRRELARPARSRKFLPGVKNRPLVPYFISPRNGAHAWKLCRIRRRTRRSRPSCSLSPGISGKPHRYKHCYHHSGAIVAKDVRFTAFLVRPRNLLGELNTTQFKLLFELWYYLKFLISCTFVPRIYVWDFGQIAAKLTRSVSNFNWIFKAELRYVRPRA